MKQLILRMPDQLKSELDAITGGGQSTNQAINECIQTRLAMPVATQHVRDALGRISKVQSAGMKAGSEGAKLPPDLWGALIDLSGAVYALVEALRICEARPTRNRARLIDMPGPGEPASEGGK